MIAMLITIFLMGFSAGMLFMYRWLNNDTIKPKRRSWAKYPLGTNPPLTTKRPKPTPAPPKKY